MPLRLCNQTFSLLVQAAQGQIGQQFGVVDNEFNFDALYNVGSTVAGQAALVTLSFHAADLPTVQAVSGIQVHTPADLSSLLGKLDWVAAAGEFCYSSPSCSASPSTIDGLCWDAYAPYSRCEP